MAFFLLDMICSAVQIFLLLHVYIHTSRHYYVESKLDLCKSLGKVKKRVSLVFLLISIFHLQNVDTTACILFQVESA